MIAAWLRGGLLYRDGAEGNELHAPGTDLGPSPWPPGGTGDLQAGCGKGVGMKGRSKKNRRRRSDLSRAASSLGSPTPVLPARFLGPVPAPEALLLWATRGIASRFMARELLRADPCGCLQHRTPAPIRQGENCGIDPGFPVSGAWLKDPGIICLRSDALCLPT